MYFIKLFSGMCKAENIIVSAPSENNKKPWRDIGTAITTDNSKLIIIHYFLLYRLSILLN